MSTKKPTKICQYGENCYRKNPVHFGEFSHPHLEKILQTGVDSTGRYKVPDELFMSKDVVLIQIGILENLFPDSKIRAKTETRKDEKMETANRTKSVSDPVSEIEISSDDDEEKSKSASNENVTEMTTPARNLSTSSHLSASSSNDHTRSRSRSPQPSTSEGDGSKSCKTRKVTKNINDYIPVVLPKGQMAKKLENAAPYNFFLTAITDSKSTHSESLTVTLQEILDDSLGKIESSVQINFMVDIGWLLGHYYFAGCLDAPLLVLYGDDTPELRTISQFKPQVTAIKVTMATPFSTHHTKMMLLGYTDGSMRVVISTANLYEDDWHNRTQGIWISPKLEALPEGVDTTAGESQTRFRNDLMLYLVEYKLPKLQPWIARIRRTDFSKINVFLVASCPGGFREGSNGFKFGHARLGSLLSKHSSRIDENCPVVAQSSSIGSLGPNIGSWVQSDFLNSARKDSTPLGIKRLPAFKMIYPSFGNVKSSHDGMLGGGCLPYGKNTDDKQPWLKNHLHQWKSKARHRSQAMPHIKTYTRWSDEGVFWFVLTSANLSKAAWGAFNKNTKIEPCLRINNYEAGVLFLPKFVTGESTFPLHNSRGNVPPFPMPYDVPLTPYGPDDKPFLMDYLQSMLG